MNKKEAIANINHIYGMVAPDIQRSFDVAIKCMEERPQGEWIFDGEDTFKCSVCNTLLCCGDNFCPNCGADMRKGGADNG